MSLESAAAMEPLGAASDASTAGPREQRRNAGRRMAGGLSDRIGLALLLTVLVIAAAPWVLSGSREN